MVQVPPKLLEVARRENPPTATDTEIADLRGLTGMTVPSSYIDFIRTVGFLELDPLDDPRYFKYTYREPELSMEFQGSIARFTSPAKIVTYYTNLVLEEADDEFPKFPAFFLPIGRDAGQSHVLLECGGDRDRVWFWEFQSDAWGQANNVRLGFVADSFEGFLKALYVYDG